MVDRRVIIGVFFSNQQRVTKSEFSTFTLSGVVDEAHLGAVGVQYSAFRETLDTHWHVDCNRSFIIEEMTSSVRTFGVDSRRIMKFPQPRIKPDVDRTWHTSTRR